MLMYQATLFYESNSLFHFQIMLNRMRYLAFRAKGEKTYMFIKENDVGSKRHFETTLKDS